MEEILTATSCAAGSVSLAEAPGGMVTIKGAGDVESGKPVDDLAGMVATGTEGMSFTRQRETVLAGRGCGGDFPGAWKRAATPECTGIHRDTPRRPSLRVFVIVPEVYRR